MVIRLLFQQGGRSTRTFRIPFTSCHKIWYIQNFSLPVEIKCQLDATEVYIADLAACSTCFGHHCAHHQELKSIIQWLLPVVFRVVVFKLLVCGAAVQHTSPHRTSRTHTKCYAAASPHWLFTFLTNFKISDFNKEHTSSLKMIWMMIETRWSVLKCFNMNILD